MGCEGLGKWGRLRRGLGLAARTTQGLGGVFPSRTTPGCPASSLPSHGRGSPTHWRQLGGQTGCLTTRAYEVFSFKKCLGTSLVAQWLGICLPMQGTWVRSLVGEPRAHRLQGNEASVPQLLKPPHCTGNPEQTKKTKVQISLTNWGPEGRRETSPTSEGYQPPCLQNLLPSHCSGPEWRPVPQPQQRAIQPSGHRCS